MAILAAKGSILDGLNPEQAAAASHGRGSLLIIAGAGTGKTRTLVHRVAHLVGEGVDPSRIMLLTFTRRAAAEMLRRVDGVVRGLSAGMKREAAPAGDDEDPSAVAGSRLSRLDVNIRRLWGGTFHSVATRLLRAHGKQIGLEPGFTIHDRSDSEDLLDVVRTELGLTRTDKRFPKKGTCLAIYSNCVNSRRPLEEVLADAYPWCQDYAASLKKLFQTYVDRKEAGSVLDYDDLLLFWRGLLADEQAGQKVRSRFDCVLVDEYQDTNLLQGEILRLLCPDGNGLTVVGDDAQSIYSFRAATVRNILDFPQQFPGTTVVTLEQNYRSMPPILAASNSVIEQARDRYAKRLWSERPAGERPWLVTCEDENEQAEFLVRRILEHREAGIDLRRQAVLFRTSHHSIVLEAELARANIPFVKYGGLKFMETAHVKDLLAFLRLVENPRDVVAGSRVLMLLAGIGPKRARQCMDELVQGGGDFRVWQKTRTPTAKAEQWTGLIKLMLRLGEMRPSDLPAQLHLVRRFYGPLLEDKYDNTAARLRDLEQIEQLAGRFADRASLLAEIALDPPTTTEDFAGEPRLDEDYLVLSTIHSAKGLEWDAVYVIHAADGNIPSDMATRSPEQIDEERRLFYVALTRAKDWLCVCFPQRYYQGHRGSFGDRHGYAQLTRFLPEELRIHFDCRVAAVLDAETSDGNTASTAVRRNIRREVRAMWG
ncbi:MAG TPA: ATP-dependent helicase [Pirellulales bacterium]|nr:ATP-dependent helicase [Pirellulales bacterium]